MGRVIGFLYGTLTYIFSLVVFLYLIAFLGNITELFGITLPVERTIDGPQTLSAAFSYALKGEQSTSGAYLVNFVLLALFGVQHTVMARFGFKDKLRAMIGEKMERPTYVFLTSLLLVLLYWQWRPIPEVVWSLDGFMATLMWTGFWAGWGIILLATFLIDHFELFGLKQAIYQLQGKAMPKHQFVTPILYKLCRHPIYLGWILTFWCTPVMSRGHLFFAVVWTAYIFIAVPYEEKDLTTAFGKKYTDYKAKTPMIFPFTKFKK